MRRARIDDDENLKRFQFPFIELSRIPDDGLERMRRRRIVNLSLWMLMLAAGILGAATLAATPLLQVLAFAAVFGGLVTVPISAAGIARVVGEQRARDAQRRAAAAMGPSRWEER